MPLNALTGTRLRERRLAMGLRQAELAERVGVSASYLNLIEHNRRRIADDLLERFAAALNVAVATLREGAEGAVMDGLRAAAAEVPEAAPEVDRAEDFAGRFPGWAAAVTTLAQRARALGRAVEALNDRMTHDPHLSASLHEVLSAVSSVRSTASILVDTEDLDPEWRGRFHRNLHEDSERLASGAAALVGYLDAAGQGEDQGLASPQEELEAWATTQDWQLTGEVAGLASAAARILAKGLMTQAERDRAALPDSVLAAVLAKTGPEPLALAAESGADVLTAFRRLALRPASGLGLVLCDASGTLTLRKPISAFALPRFGAACPLWPLFTALARPQTPVETVVAMPGPQGARFRVWAWCQVHYPKGARGPELRQAAMLIAPEPAGPDAAAPVGSTCRICLQPECAARREPSILTA